MDYLYEGIVVLHFIGLAALLGGFLVQMSSSPKVVNNAMVHGALTQFVTGLLLVGLAETLVEDEEVDHMKVGLKLIILLVITGLVWANRKKDSIPTGVWAAIGGLTIVNVGIAVLV